MKQHIQTILIVWGILTTITILYFFTVIQKQERINTLLTESISLHKKAIANEVSSYNAIHDCFVTKRGLCDADEFKEKLQT